MLKNFEEYAAMDNKVFIQVNPSPTENGGLINYYAGSSWTDIALVPDSYRLVRTDASGAVAEITQINTLTNPSCT